MSYKQKLDNFIMSDGSRQFIDLPETVEWDQLRDHITRLPGSKLTGYLTDHIVEVWIDFTFKDNNFTVHNFCGDYLLSVEDQSCPDEILLEVVNYCAQITGYRMQS